MQARAQQPLLLLLPLLRLWLLCAWCAPGGTAATNTVSSPRGAAAFPAPTQGGFCRRRGRGCRLLLLLLRPHQRLRARPPAGWCG